MASSAKHTLIMTRLDRSRFVERVDHLTSPGYLKSHGSRKKAGLVGNGPIEVVTDKAVFRFEEDTKEIYLSELYPGINVEEIKKNVSFRFSVSPSIITVKPPKRAEIELMRNFDPSDIVLRRRMVFRDLDFERWVRLTKDSLQRTGIESIHVNHE